VNSIRRVLFCNGEGLAQNNAEAISWYRLAATQEHAHAIATNQTFVNVDDDDDDDDDDGLFV
jgi:hypothetical protein